MRSQRWKKLPFLQLTKREWRKINSIASANATTHFQKNFPSRGSSAWDMLRMIVDGFTAGPTRSGYRHFLATHTDAGRECEYNRIHWKEIKRMKSTLIRLRQKGLIEIGKRADGLRIALTDAGVTAMMRDEVLRCTRLLPKDQHILVVFDIPEHARAARHQFRSLLREAKFNMVQRSVWQSRKDVAIPLRAFITRANIDSWVTLFVGIPK